MTVDVGTRSARFSARPFESLLYSKVALANAFDVPWESADRLRMPREWEWKTAGVHRGEGGITAIVDDCREMLRPLRDAWPTEVCYLERQIGHSTGFYRIIDYRGAL